MLTILQITPSYKPAYFYGGPTLSVSKLCEELHKSECQVKVLTTTANGPNELQLNTKLPNKVAQVDVYHSKRITKDPTHFSPALLIKLVKMIREHKKKNSVQLVVHIHSWWNTVAILSSLISLWYRIPVVLSPRGMLTAYSLQNRHAFCKRMIHKFFGKFILKHCFIHATSEQEKQDIIATIKKYRSITVIPNFVKYPGLLRDVKAVNYSSTKSIFKLLFLSRIEEKKGLDILIKALPELKMNWQLTIAGHGDSQYIHQLKQLCSDLNIAQQVNWIGEVNNTRKFEVYRNNDLFILPSHNENFGNVVIESLSMGTPVLLSKEVGLASYVLKNNLGWITERQSSQIALMLNRAATEHGKRTWIRREGPKIIRKDYTEKALVTKYMALYQQILKNGN